jgi:hypothetical protein
VSDACFFVPVVMWRRTTPELRNYIVLYTYRFDRTRLLVIGAVFLALAFAGCSPAASGPGQVPNAPPGQGDIRDTSGMH